MKVEYEYSSEEVLALVLKVHALQVSPPDGMVWVARFDRYSSQDVFINAVTKETEGGTG